MKLIIYYKSNVEIKDYFTSYNNCFLLDRILYQYILSNCFDTIILAVSMRNTSIEQYINNHKIFSKHITIVGVKPTNDTNTTHIDINYLYNIDSGDFYKFITAAKENGVNYKIPGGKIVITNDYKFVDLDIQHIEFKNEKDIRLGKIEYSRWEYHDDEGD